MTDIVATLRKTDQTKMPINDHDHKVLHRIAANEIERLRDALQEAEIYFGDEWPDKIRAMAR